MGCGKSHIGDLLATTLWRPFVDLDIIIQQNTGMEISVLFEKFGEAYFRELETKTLRRLPLTDGAIIALGGGTPCHSENLQWILDNGLVIYIQVEQKELYRRLLPEKKSRPMLAHLQDDTMELFLEKQLKEREKIYLQAHHIFNPRIHSLTDLGKWISSS